MAAIVSLDAYRQRRRGGNTGPPVRLAELVRETVAPTCDSRGRPIVLDRAKDPWEARLTLAKLVAERLCASCFSSF